ncbi:MAG: MarR family transcriptional regulator, partial [Paracoccus sp. (in: a-proteobacteria)]|nr:MarR family transcriptional regulator [Paracoccus sp. (in: a-proteobacteria)]
SNLVLVIDELEERGLITRTKVPTDRRRSALNATLRGRRLRDRAAARVKAAEDAIIGRLDAADRDLLLATLTALEDRATRGN